MKRIRVLLVQLTALAFAFAQMASAVTTFYVTTNGTGNLSGTDWANATNNLQGAIDAIATAATNTVWVSNGVYQTGGVTNWPAGSLLTNRVVITKNITVRSWNTNPANTIIKGAWDIAANGPGPAAVRCVYMSAGTLIGFTLTNGATLATGGGDDKLGGNLDAILGGVVSNCVIAGGNASSLGGGAYGGTIWNCIFQGNRAGSGGGSYVCVYSYSCIYTGNVATTGSGGGGFDGAYYYCTFVNNVSLGTASTVGGGAVASDANAINLYNCLLIGNKAVNGGGAVFAKAANGLRSYNNCTIVGNEALVAGGGIYASDNFTPNTLNNSIVYFNSAPASPDWYGTNYFTNCCTSSSNGINWVGGWVRSTTNYPIFVANGNGYGTNLVAGNYRLNGNSPGVNTGTNGSWTTTYPYDLDGRARIRYGTVDMGPYETIYKGAMFGFR